MKGMNESFKQRKGETLHIYEEYLSFKNQYGDNVDADLLENKCTNIKNDKFLLIVAGEAKSGKSTFINAFLGAEILPMDSKQCTSALIEINYDENRKLEAEYADGRSVTINNGDEVYKFLNKHAALKDEYRKIPVTTINNEILIKSKGKIRPGEVEDLISRSKGDNTYSLPDDEYAKLINQYINDNKDKWGDIVVKISVTHPFSEGMRDITIIDSPGVNAVGLVGEITNRYIGKADAVIFVKALGGGHALESSSFREFLKSSAISRSEAAILFVLTRTTELDGEKVVNSLKEQAREMYKSYFKPEQIAAIDSKLQLYFHLCSRKTEDEINEFIEKSEFKAAGFYWYKSGKQRAEFLQLLQKESNFDHVISMLDKFALKVHYIQLLDFLYMIARGYEALTKKIEERLVIIYGSDSPEQLSRKIKGKKDEIAEIELKMHEGIDHIRRNFVDDGGIIQHEAKEAFDKFKKELSSVMGKENIEKKFLEGQDLFSKAQIDIPERVINDCNQKLTNISDRTSIPAATIIPVFPPDYFKNLFDETKGTKEAYDNWEETTGFWCFKEIRKHSDYSLYKHIEVIKKNALAHLNETKDRIIGSLFAYVGTIINVYSESLKVNMDKKNGEYDKLCLDLDTAEKMREEAKKLEKDLPDIRLASEKTNSIKGAIEDVIKN